MTPNVIRCAVFALVFATSQYEAAEPAAPPPEEFPALNQEAGGKDPPKPPDKKLPPKKEIDPFTPAPLSRGETSVGYNPQMLGDFGGILALQRITVIGTQTTTTTTTFVRRNKDGTFNTFTKTAKVPKPISQSKLVLIPVASAGVFKVAENESPMPRDRVFLTYNYFANLQGPQVGANAPLNSTQTTTSGPGGGTRTTTDLFIPSAPRVTADLHRQVFGFEKTFLDGFASIELRVPIVQQAGSVDGFSSRYGGDLTIIGKYAFLMDPVVGDVLSGGLAVTAPTGPSIDTLQGPLHSTLLQPWFGYIRNFDRFYVQGFHSLVAPTDARDVALLFNDVGVNYWLYRGGADGLVSAVVPTFEVHVTTPLNQRTMDGPIFVPDIVTLTGGVHLGLRGNSSLSLGVVTPISGPRPFNIEAFAQFNWRF